MPAHLQSPRTPSRGFRRREKAWIRTIKSSEIFDAAFAIYRRDGLELLRLLILPTAVTFGLFSLSWHLVGRNLFTTTRPDSVWQQAQELILLMLVGSLAAAPAVLLAYSYMTGVTSLFVALRHLNRRPSPDVIQRTVIRRLPALALLNLSIIFQVVGFVLLGSGLVLLSALIDSMSAGRDALAPVVSLLGVVGLFTGVAGIPYIYARLCLAPVVMLQEGTGVRDSLRRSKELMAAGRNSQIGTVIGLLLITALLQSVLWGSLQLPATLISDALLTSGVAVGSVFIKMLYAVLSIFGGFASFLLVHPILLAGITLIYFDRRVCREGFDIELLAQDMWKSDRAIDFDI